MIRLAKVANSVYPTFVGVFEHEHRFSRILEGLVPAMACRFDSCPGHLEAKGLTANCRESFLFSQYDLGATERTIEL